MDIYRELKEVQYYYDRMSMFLKESLGIKERVKFFVDLLNKIDEIYDELIKRFDINNKFDGNGIYKLENYKAQNYANDTDDVFLDIIGKIFNVSRYIRLKDLKYDSNDNIVINSNKYINITLTNYELLIYIKYVIAKQNFLGTREELKELYGGENIGIESNKGVLDLQFIYSPNQTSANCYIYWNDYVSNGYSNKKNYVNYYNDSGTSEKIEDTDVQNINADYTYNNKKVYNNLAILFMNELLTIQSLGILYNLSLLQIDDTAVWDTDEVYYWDSVPTNKTGKVGYWS